MEEFKSTDDRRVGNTLRHAYRQLTEAEKQQMDALKDAGAAFIDLLDQIPPGREAALARTKIEEAVMWAVKGLTR